MPTPYQPKRAQVPYGLHVPYDHGYDAKSRRKAPTAESNGASGMFKRGNDTIALWLTDISADFSLSGTQAQSRMLREFFPHSFNDVTLHLTGNVASTQEYNRLALFVRQHQWSALQTINSGGSAPQTIDFTLYSTYANGRTPYSGPTVKGPHRPWTVSGYVASIAAGATRHEVAPEFTVDFIVATSTIRGNTGIWSDTLASGSTLKSFLDILGVKGSSKAGKGFIQDPISAPATTHPKKKTTRSVGKTVAGTWSGAAAKTFGF